MTIRDTAVKLDTEGNSMSVELRAGEIFAPKVSEIRVRFEYGKVVAFLDRVTRIEMSTPAAVKIGMAMNHCYTQAQQGDLVIWKINGQDVQLLPLQARMTGGAMLKKADRADDWQRDVSQSTTREVSANDR